MLLTIGMIVKNEEKYLERCLNGIKPILDSVESELIITDTGSTDRTVEIAKNFTDKVLSFEWCDDFSAARNYSLSKATGDWILVVDDDVTNLKMAGHILSKNNMRVTAFCLLTRTRYSSPATI